MSFRKSESIAIPSPRSSSGSHSGSQPGSQPGSLSNSYGSFFPPQSSSFSSFSASRPINMRRDSSSPGTSLSTTPGNPASIPSAAYALSTSPSTFLTAAIHAAQTLNAAQRAAALSESAEEKHAPIGSNANTHTASSTSRKSSIGVGASAGASAGAGEKDKDREKEKEKDKQKEKDKDKQKEKDKDKQKEKDKDAEKDGAPGSQTPSVPRKAAQAIVPAVAQFDDAKRLAKITKKQIIPRELSKKQVPLFSHLPQYESTNGLSLGIVFSKTDIHPAVIRFGMQLANHQIIGTNARCVGLLTSIRQFIQENSTPSNEDYKRDIDQKLKLQVQFLVECRHLGIGMGNIVTWLKAKIYKISPTMTELQSKEHLIELIDNFIAQRIQHPVKAIAVLANEKIADGDVILTYSSSSSVEETLIMAHQSGKKFRVIVADSRPFLEGKDLLTRLSKAGIASTYVLINALPYVMKTVTKVFVGAHAMLQNGNCLSRVGTSMVAMTAKACNVPFIVCCEIYKYSERVQLDSICWNELGDADNIARTGNESNVLSKWRDIEHLRILNLKYDVTPMDFVTMVISEVGMLPPTSVPVVLREYRKDMERV